MRGLRQLLAATAALLVLAPPAAADVRIDEREVVVRGPVSTAVVERAPFSLRIEDRRGRTILRSAGAGRRGPLVIGPASDPAPVGAELGRTATLYSPLSVLVAARPLVQWPAGPWVANMLTGTAAGVAYASGDVVAARREGGGAAVEIATDDPSGRRIELTVAPGEGGMRVRARVTPGSGVAGLAASFSTAPGEAFRGFGGRHNGLDQRGRDFLGWVQQQNTGAGDLQPVANAVPGGGGESYLFPNGPTAAYYVAPAFVSSRGYGYLLERDELSRWRMASDREDAWQVEVGGTSLDQLVVHGGPARSIRRLTRVTGRHRAPPDWVLGPLIDRSTIAFTQSPDGYAAQVRDDLRQLRSRDIHITGYRVEGWDFLPRAQLRPILEELRARDIHPLAYFRSFVSADGAGTENPQITQEAFSRGYLVRNNLGLPYVFGGNFFGASALIDFTNPAAVEWWKRRITEALDLGFDGFMQDFGEQVLQDMRFHDGSDGAAMHNAYPTLFHRVTRDAVEEWERAHPERGPVWFFTRAGYAGRSGSARYEGSNFAGDGNTDFSRSSGLASQAPDMLNRAIGGAYGFTTDIGGYFDYVTPKTTKELFIRWAQWATLSPVMRVHGSINAGTHMPWTYDDETVQEYRRLVGLRLRARPLIARLWRAATRTGIPVTRPLWLSAPEAPGAASEDQQWLLGEDVLVAPVVRGGARERAVSFPRGCWQHGETGTRYRGPARRTVAAPLLSLPWFVRCGRRLR